MQQTDEQRRNAHIGRGWIGVDLDGTLAHYDTFLGPRVIGPPIMPMLERVRDWLDKGHEVRIFTARVSSDPKGEARAAIYAWCDEHLGRVLDVTCVKDFEMIELWDDRAVQVIPNTGVCIADELAAERAARAGKP